jgi:uncharacterized protein
VNRKNNLSQWTYRITLMLITFTIVFDAAAAIPSRPNMQKKLTFDAAKAISPAAEKRIFTTQLKAFQEQDVAIVVVTITNMAKYDGNATDIEDFAKDWFHKWRIGKSGNGRGVLVLVSLHDRKVRVHLGEDWGHRWDGHCQRLLKQKVLPKFKQKDYSGGVEAAVKELGRMSAAGPEGKIPSAGVFSILTDTEFFHAANAHNPVPTHYRIWVALIGVILIAVGCSGGRGAVGTITCGVLCVASIFAFWPAVIIAFILLILTSDHCHSHGRYGHRHRHSSSSCFSSSSGSSSSGGGVSFGGGGGASGGW